MSYPYQGQGAPYGIPTYDNEPPRQRPVQPGPGRMQAPRGPAGLPSQQQQRAQPLNPNLRSAQNQRFPVRQPPQVRQPTGPQRPQTTSTENLYDGSAFGDEPEEPQWPLPARPIQQARAANPGNSRGPPPQRPQRPDFVPPILDPPRPAQRPRVAPADQQYQQRAPPQQWPSDNYASPNYPSPNPSRPTTQSSGGSTSSSNVSIPDFPVPQIPPQMRRPPLGPPPSSRRGPASYYPQMAPVHPIAEETDSVRGSLGAKSMGSFASSNAIPIGIPDYYLQDDGATASEDEQEPPRMDSANGRESRLGSRDESYPEDEEETERQPPGLVRQASLGKRSKPTLTTIKSGDNLRNDPGAVQSGQKGTGSARDVPNLPSQRGTDSPSRIPQIKRPSREELKPTQRAFGTEKDFEAGGAAALVAAAVAAPLYEHRNDSKEQVLTRTNSSEILGSGTGLIDPSSSEDEKKMRKKRSKELLGAALQNPPRSRSRSPLAGVDPRVEQILGGLEKGGALDSSAAERMKSPERKGGLAERVGARRPPRLNVDAVRDAEARGSLTSLPDLIKRATRLASNLDRGRTASRLGMNWFEESCSDREKRGSGLSDNRRSGSISDMLASFPPPGLATPPGSGSVRRSLTQWPSNLRHSALASASDIDEAQRKQKRRCCGMPLWLFLLLLVILILLVAAAIIVPVVLVVVPRQSNSGGTAASCQSSMTCQNGGTSIVGSDGSCRCLCVNGFSGAQCTVDSKSGCTTTSVGSTQDATVGNAIPRLLSGAESNFSVPLDGPMLLSLFSSANLSCSSENALVSFNGLTSRSFSDLSESELPLLAQLQASPLPVETGGPTPTINRRQDSTGSGVAATSNGIVYESGSPSVASSTPTASSTTSSGSSPTSTSEVSTMDFARVAVLFVFQASGQLGDAVTAQENLQSFYTSGTTSTGQNINPANVSLGNGFTCDLSGHSIMLSNGTSVGGT